MFKWQCTINGNLHSARDDKHELVKTTYCPKLPISCSSCESTFSSYFSAVGALGINQHIVFVKLGIGRVLKITQFIRLIVHSSVQVLLIYSISCLGPSLKVVNRRVSYVVGVLSLPTEQYEDTWAAWRCFAHETVVSLSVSLAECLNWPQKIAQNNCPHFVS